MDPITHSMVGAVMARAGLDRQGRLPLAATTLVLAANAPDIDIFIMFAGSYAGIGFRRGWTHGPIALVLLPFVLTALMLAWDALVRRRRDPSTAALPAGPTLLIAAIGVVSHPALDWLNTYGIRLLMPFSDRWFYGDAVFIIDPWLYLMLGAALLPWRRTVTRVRAFGGLATAYIVAMVVASAAAEPAIRRHAEAAGIAGIQEVMYQPAPAQPHRGSLVVASEAGYLLGAFDWLAADRVALASEALPRGDWTDPAVRIARQDPRVRDYLTWSRFPYVRVERTTVGRSVFFGDARFIDGPSGGGLQGVRIIVPE